MFRSAATAVLMIGSVLGCAQVGASVGEDAAAPAQTTEVPQDAGTSPTPPSKPDASTLPVIQPDAGGDFDGGNPQDVQLPAGLVLPEDSGPLEVEIGRPESSSGLGFGVFDAGGEIPIGGAGQAGLTARLAVRIREAPGVDATRLFIRVEVTNVVDSAPLPGVREFDVPDPLRCEKGWCYSTAIRVEISHLAKLPELEGTLVRVRADVRSDADPSAIGTSYTWGYFAAQR